jgi:phosphate transport system substrate-binding protein
MPRSRNTLLVLLALSACNKAPPTSPAPYQIHIAGSSAGFPLSSEVAERLMREDPDVLAPLVRAGGTGEGIASFCDTPNPTRPDILITTRTMTPGEQARCAADGSPDVEQKAIGATAIALVEAKGASPLHGLTRADVASALTSSAKTWAEVRPSLPAVPIVIHGPTPMPAIADTLYGPFLEDGQKVRTDGAYIGHGADADFVARLVAEKPGTIGIIPIGQLVAHSDSLASILVTGGPTASMEPGANVTMSGVIGVPLFLIHRPNDSRLVPGLGHLLGYYDDALRRPREDIFRSRAIP